ncbi:MAG: MerR family transcriptional regulator [Peptococcaceae bacterium]
MGYAIKEVSERFHISPYTLRYYEKEGLLPPIHRTDKGNRLYSNVDLEWLQLICCMRATGMSIAYIKDYVDLCRLGEDTVTERRQIILNQKKIIENELKKYQNLLKMVNKKLKYYDHITHSDSNPESPA